MALLRNLQRRLAERADTREARARALAFLAA